MEEGQVKLKPEEVVKVKMEEENVVSGDLGKEVEELRSIVLSQAAAIKTLGETVLQGTPPPVQTPSTNSVTTKPRDVPKLCLEELVGIEATGRLALFFLRN